MSNRLDDGSDDGQEMYPVSCTQFRVQLEQCPAYLEDKKAHTKKVNFAIKTLLLPLQTSRVSY